MCSLLLCSSALSTCAFRASGFMALIFVTVTESLLFTMVPRLLGRGVFYMSPSYACLRHSYHFPGGLADFHGFFRCCACRPRDVDVFLGCGNSLLIHCVRGLQFVSDVADGFTGGLCGDLCFGFCVADGFMSVGIPWILTVRERTL